MIAYFDTSALLPLLIDEPDSERAGLLWDQADHVASIRLVYVEARAALAQARRLDRLDDEQLPGLVEQLDELYEQLDRIAIDETLVRRAGSLALEQGLRGYDAVHLAGVDRIAGDDTVFVSSDSELCAAATRLGIAVSDTASRDG